MNEKRKKKERANGFCVFYSAFAPRAKEEDIKLATR